MSNFNTPSKKTRQSEPKTVEEMLMRATQKTTVYVNEMILATDSHRDFLMRVREGLAVASHLHRHCNVPIPDNEIQKLIIKSCAGFSGFELAAQFLKRLS